ncbi:MAG: AraC family transcriptional regulator [Cyanobacteria bacterium P01_A01_bin.17]
MSSTSKVAVNAWESPGIVLEHYAYSAGTVTPLPPHAHPEYQFGLSFNCQGEYTYRGTVHPIPIGTLSLIHTGEAHAPSQRTSLPAPATFWMMQVDPSVMQKAASEVIGKPTTPFVPELFLSDHNLVQRLLVFCRCVTSDASQLEQDVALIHFLAPLITRHAEGCLDAVKAPVHRPAVVKARDFLQTHYSQNTSLAELATLSGISRFHLSRIFRQETGLSLSAYQQQLRVNQAKKLLVRGLSISEAATAVGFYDQSHLGRHFKCLIGVTPGDYTRSSQ